MPLPQCCAIKADGNRCTSRASRLDADTHPEHLDFCGTHKPCYNRMVHQVFDHTHHTPGRCYHTARAWAGMPLARRTVWCPFAAEAGQMFCGTHAQRQANRAARAVAANNDREMVQTLFMALRDQEPQPTWRQAAQVIFLMPDVALEIRRKAAFRYFQRFAWDVAIPVPARWRFDAYWRWIVDGQQGPEPDLVAPPVQPQPPPAPELGRMARDPQNVHTRAVTDQTNTATEKLLAVKVPETQQTEKTLTLVWLGGLSVSYHTYLRVATDINRWFNTKDCRVPNDNLYRRMLRGLVALIGSEKDDERKSEMYRRAWEECTEAVGMCCEGHLSRLCNVLVGFDEAFQPPVPFGEILQSKMAAIAGLDVSEEEKRRQANAFFDEHKTPVEERAAWLDAF